MTDSPCPFLDELDWDRSPADQALFDRHLEHCEACRNAIRAQKRMDALLAEATDGIESPPGLVERITHQTHRRQIRRWSLRAVSAAALLLIALGLAALMEDSDQPRPDVDPRMAKKRESTQPNRIPDQKTPTPEPTPSRPEVVVQFANEDKLLTVQSETSHPDVTLIWVYPTVNTTLQTSPETESTEDERNDL